MNPQVPDEPRGSEPDAGLHPPYDEAGHAPPWWHTTPSQPPVDSVFVEGLKLAGALRDWAVESGAVAAASEMAQNVASVASAYVAQATSGVGTEHEGAAAEHEGVDDRPVVRCSDCPVCQGLDALDRTNPEWARTARSALAQVNAVMSTLLGDLAGTDDRSNP